MFASKAAINNPNDVTLNAYATDITSWVATLRGRTGQRCIWILGHSEGATVALLAGLTLPDTCGLILAAAPGRPLGIILRDQLRAIPANAPIIDQAFTVIESLERGRCICGSRPLSTYARMDCVLLMILSRWTATAAHELGL